MSHDHVQVEEEVTEFVCSGAIGATSELQCLGEMRWVCRALRCGPAIAVGRAAVKT